MAFGRGPHHILQGRASENNASRRDLSQRQPSRTVSNSTTSRYAGDAALAGDENRAPTRGGSRGAVHRAYQTDHDCLPRRRNVGTCGGDPGDPWDRRDPDDHRDRGDRDDELL